jgi:DHA2 family multidrug resistance protein
MSEKGAPLTGVALLIASLFLSLSCFMEVLDYSIANVAIPYIAGDLGVSRNEGTWVITLFAVGNAITLPLTGWLTTRYGTIRVMALSTFLFAIASWLCGVSVSFGMLIASRFVQGLVAGPLIPLSQSLMLLIFPETKKNIAIAIWTMVALVGPIAGPILGGWITTTYTWNWIFLINVPLGLIASFVIWQVLKERETEGVKRRVDFVGLLLLALTVTALQVMLDRGEQDDWFRSPTIRLLAGTSVVSLIFLLIWEATERDPILDLSLFRDRNFALGSTLTAISYMVLFGAIVITPLWLQTTMGYNAYWAGLAVAPMGVFPLIAAPFVAKLMDRYPARYLLGVSFLIFAAVFFLFSRFTTAVSFSYIAHSRFLLGIGLSLWLGPLMALSLSYIPRERFATATGIFHFMRIFSGGAGTSLFVTLWDRRVRFHHSNLTEGLTPFDQTAREFFNGLKELGFTSMERLRLADIVTTKQAYMLSSNDLFWLSMIASLTFFCAVFFFKKRRKEVVPTGEG